MKVFSASLFIILLISATAAHAVGILPTLELEKKIAYQQGQFGALYAHCGTSSEKEVIGGSLSVWRNETFRGYKGTPEEHAALEKEFDAGTDAVNQDASSCNGWIKQASATWRGIVQLSQYGMPAQQAANP